MIRKTLFATALFAASQLAAQTYRLDTDRSLSELETELSQVSQPGASEQMAFGAVLFLRGIEQALQQRYEFNLGVTSDMMAIPVMRLPVPPNPNGKPFRPELIAEMFETVEQSMARSRAALHSATPGPQDKLEIDVAGLWFDIDRNGSKGANEALTSVLGASLFSPWNRPPFSPTAEMQVHFDAADRDWLIAYTHLLSGTSQLVLAFDPTDVISEVLSSNVKMAEIQGGLPRSGFLFFSDEEKIIDMFAMVYGALNRRPNPGRIQAAHGHFLEMIASNRTFWALANAENDDSQEWIPNASQTAALGFQLPKDTSEVWQSVLADGEAILNGDLLVPHWRITPGGGINVAKMIEDPPAVDIVTWIQGHGLLPYMEKGPLVTSQNMRRLEEMFSGNTLLFMVLLN